MFIFRMLIPCKYILGSLLKHAFLKLAEHDLSLRNYPCRPPSHLGSRDQKHTSDIKGIPSLLVQGSVAPAYISNSALYQYVY